VCLGVVGLRAIAQPRPQQRESIGSSTCSLQEQEQECCVHLRDEGACLCSCASPGFGLLHQRTLAANSRRRSCAMVSYAVAVVFLCCTEGPQEGQGDGMLGKERHRGCVCVCSRVAQGV